MIKIFETSDIPEVPPKINFVDSNNVFVGYEIEQNCCEHATWCISESIQEDIPNEEFLENRNYNLENYVFDPEFFERDKSEDKLEGVEVVIFKMVGDGPDLYLHLFNEHNGYYSHGFEFGKKNSNEIMEGMI